MGDRSGGEVQCFEGVSEFVSEDDTANLDEAIDEALAAARAGGARPGDVFDVTIRVTLREDNQNVKAYGAMVTKSGGSGRI
jgi:hypothetical protein